MPRSIWKGAISFGLVAIPVKVFGATEERDISFRQVHSVDGGRIRYQRVCEVCGQEIAFSDIAKGYEADDGRLAILEPDDFAGLPAAEGKTVDVKQFVELAQIDPIYFDRTYLLAPEPAGLKPYLLLRRALADSGRAAVVKVALRNKESLALIRPVGEVLRLHTMLWPDELRDTGFAAPAAEVKVSQAEVAMAELLIDQLFGEFDPSAYTDDYREALTEVINAKLDGLEPAAAPAPTAEGGQVVDLVTALRASVEAAKKRRDEAAAS